MPRDAVIGESSVRAQRLPEAWDDQQIKDLADKYGVSREAMLRRLLVLGRTTERFYRRKREQFQREYEQSRGQREAGFAPPYRMAISSAGPVFVEVVLSNYHQENITASDVADFLDIRLKHLDRIESEILGRRGATA
jgi:Zn-dependent peptidase ImmA (M78 family)